LPSRWYLLALRFRTGTCPWPLAACRLALCVCERTCRWTSLKFFYPLHDREKMEKYGFCESCFWFDETKMVFVCSCIHLQIFLGVTLL
jgi:hypothetical protein